MNEYEKLQEEWKELVKIKRIIWYKWKMYKSSWDYYNDCPWFEPKSIQEIIFNPVFKKNFEDYYCLILKWKSSDFYWILDNLENPTKYLIDIIKKQNAWKF